MLHFPSKLPSNLSANGVPRRSDSLNLNATQHLRSATGAGSHPVFLKVEEELHDARRVHADGQEDDLRYALNMVINRVSELSSLLSEAYKTQADLEVQLNVAKSNLQLVIANNEMLEDALRRDTSGQAKDVGWRRSSARDSGGSARSDTSDPRMSLERSQSVDYPTHTPNYASAPPTPPSASPPPPSNAGQDNRFFKFRFSGGAPGSASQSGNRPGSSSGSPQIGHSGVSLAHQLTSPSLPSLGSTRLKEVEDLEKALEKEKKARKTIAQEKAALEEELESLSQALFEEANNMVATERKLRADAEDELKELKREKEALRSALVLVEGENSSLRLASPRPSSHGPSIGNSPQPSIRGSSPEFTRAHTRSASQTAIKSRPTSLDFSTGPYPPLPSSPAPSSTFSSSPEQQYSAPPTVDVLSPGYEIEEAQPTPRSRGPAALPDTSVGRASASDVDSRSNPMPTSNSTPAFTSTSSIRVGDSAVASSHHRSASTSSLGMGMGLDMDEPSPWADLPSRSRTGTPDIGATGRGVGMGSAGSYAAMH